MKTPFIQKNPGRLSDCISPVPANGPCRTRECCLYQKDALIGAGFLDMGETAATAVYSVYDTGYAKRSLGIHLLLMEITHSIAEEEGPWPARMTGEATCEDLP